MHAPLSRDISGLLSSLRVLIVEDNSFTRKVSRGQLAFPLPDIPIIVLTCHGERWRVIEAQRCGANEFLVKPASAQAILDRIVAIFMNPRPMVHLPNYYGPQPRGAFMQYLRHCARHQDVRQGAPPSPPAVQAVTPAPA